MTMILEVKLRSLSSKNLASFWASKVAELMTSLRSGLFLRIFFNRPSRRSVLSDRSWTSSSIKTVYLRRRGSCMISRTREPSVMNFMAVVSQNLEAKRTL